MIFSMMFFYSHCAIMNCITREGGDMLHMDHLAFISRLCINGLLRVDVCSLQLSCSVVLLFL